MDVSHMIRRMTVFLLVIAIFFSGGWIKASEVYAAADADFYLKFNNDLDNEAGIPASALMGSGSASYAGGVSDQAIHLDHDNYVQLEAGNQPLIDYTKGFTISYWIKINSTAGGDPALMGNKNWDSGGSPGWVFNAGKYNNEKYIKLNYKSTGVYSVRGDVEVCPVAQASEWTHIAATFDFDNDTVTTYANGQRVKSASNILNEMDVYRRIRRG